jgi:16S rRNA processing protein RimM
VGLEVVSEEGEALGRVREILAAGAGDVYVVDGPRGEWLLPAGPLVRNIDLAAGRLVIHVLPGLLPEGPA